MITTLVGKTFLKAYNEKYGKAYCAKDFFEKEYFELFFNHPKYMQWVTNSPFVQGITTDDEGNYGVEIAKAKLKDETQMSSLVEKLYDDFGEARISKKTQKSKGICKILLLNDNIQRKDRLKKFHENIIKGARDGSIALGYPASEEGDYGAYSGLVSDINPDTNADDVYYSWIGSGLGIGVAGGYNLLINDAEVTLKTFEGWKLYRKYLNDEALNGKLLPNKINSWNGQWLTYRLGNDYVEDFDFRRLETEGFFKQENTYYGIDTINWSNLFFSLSMLYPQKILNAYVYSLGEKNKTIGFIPLYLKAGTRLKDVFKQLFYTDLPFRTKDFQALFGMYIKSACELGNIGLQALEPRDIKKYMEEGKNFSFKKGAETLIYQSYKTWLIAMLSKNKEQITDYTSELAKLIQRYRAAAKGTGRKNLIEKDLLGSKTKKDFLDALTVMVGDIESSDLETLKELRDEVHLMTNEEFGYFNTLLKFDYAFVEKQS